MKTKWFDMQGNEIDTSSPDDSPVGYLPIIFQPSDPAPAKQQANERYAHGGGWHSFEGFNLISEDEIPIAGIQYPGDPIYRPIARASLPASTERLVREEIVFFPHGWVVVFRAIDDWEISRMD